MTDILIKVGDDASYDDGDILIAKSPRAVLAANTEHFCNRRPRVIGGILEAFEAINFKYKFQRISRTEVRRTNLETLEEHVIGPTPTLIDGRMQHMDVEMFYRRRRAHLNHRIYPNGVLYNGSRSPTLAELSALWDRIEAETQFTRTMPIFRRWRFTSIERTRHLPMRFLPISDSQAAALTETPQVIDTSDPENPKMVGIYRGGKLLKRKRSLAFRAMLSRIDLAKAEDRRFLFDLREAALEAGYSSVSVKPEAA